MLLLHRNVYLLNGRARAAKNLISRFERIGTASDPRFPIAITDFPIEFPPRELRSKVKGSERWRQRRTWRIAGRSPIIGIALSARCIVFASATSALSRGLSANSRAGKLSRAGGFSCVHGTQVR